jgi:hypothetical protein
MFPLVPPVIEIVVAAVSPRYAFPSTAVICMSMMQSVVKLSENNTVLSFDPTVLHMPASDSLGGAEDM